MHMCVSRYIDWKEVSPHSPSKKRSYRGIARDSISSTEGEVRTETPDRSHPICSNISQMWIDVMFQ